MNVMPDLAVCWFCRAPLPGPCGHDDPCPAWEDYKEEEASGARQQPVPSANAA